LFKLKEKHLDHLNGFAFAMLLAMPVIRNDIISLPTPAIILPAFFLFLTAGIRMYKSGTKIFKTKVIAYFYFIVLLFLYILISGLWNSFGFNLNQDIAKILFIIFVATAVLLTFNEKAAEYFIVWAIIFAIIATLILFNFYLSSGRLSLSGYGIDGYLTRSQLIGVGALACFSKLLFHPECNKKLYGAITFFLFIGLAISLARAAFLTGVMLAVFLIVFYFRTHKVKSYSIYEWLKNKSTRIIAGSFIVVVVVAATQIERNAARLRSLLGGSLGGREDLWKNSILGFIESPVIGYGLGSSGMVSSGRPTWYPHNLFLQILLDGGIIAFILLFSIFVYPILYTYSQYRNGYLQSYIWIPLVTCYTFLFLELSKATNFYDGRVFISLGLIIVIVVELLTAKHRRVI
jgi:O-antigen ligase